MPYIGNQPGTGVRSRFIYTATASQTTFSGADNNSKTLKYSDADYIDVYLNGVCLVPVTDYAASTKTSVVLTQAASLNDTLEVVAYDVASMADTVSKADGGTFESNVTFAAGADLITATAGTNNVRLGEGAGDSIASGGNNNVAIGKDAGTELTTGIKNTIVGSLAGDTLTDADSNVAIGYQALSFDQQGSNSVAIGNQALTTQRFTSGTNAYNTAIGAQAGQEITTAVKNTILGSLAGDALTTGGNNVAVGYSAMGGATTASLSTVVGYQAGEGITTGERNNVFGVNAGQGLTTGSSNTFIGGASTGAGNGAGKAVTTGSKNTILGTYDGNQGGLDIRTSDNNIVLSDGDGNPRIVASSTGQISVGDSFSYGSTGYTGTQFTVNADNNDYSAAFRTNTSTATSSYGLYVKYATAPDNTGNNFITCSDSTTVRFKVLSDGDVLNHDNNYGATSDVKLKDQIEDASSQWQDVKDLTIRKYKMKSDIEEKGDSNNLWRLGVIAQEVETAGMSGLVYETTDRDEDNNDLGTSTKAVKYSILYMKAVKALQEAMDRIETLEAKVTALENA